MRHPHYPILLERGAILNPGDAFGFPVEAFNEALSTAEAGQPRHGVIAAAELLLTTAPVAIQYVNTDVSERPISEGERPHYIRPDTLIAYSGHDTGSDGRHKVVVNRRGSNGLPSQAVLFSPPDSVGRPSNTIFHESSLGNLSQPPRVIHEDDVPNPLKAIDAAHAQGRTSYEYFLIGDGSVPRLFPQVLQAAGFTFAAEPYQAGLLGSELYELKELSDQARDYPWPNGLFAEQVARLQAEERRLLGQ